MAPNSTEAAVSLRRPIGDGGSHFSGTLLLCGLFFSLVLRGAYGARPPKNGRGWKDSYRQRRRLTT